MPTPLDVVRSLCEKYPGWEKAFLFGDHEVYRVNKKVYVWLGDGEKGGTYVSVKLKDTQGAALMLPFVKPAAYGMAKYGWINADFPKGKIPSDLVAQWIEESYRHTAPKKLLKQLAAERGEAPAPAPKSKAAPKKKAPAKPAKKKR
ncbi:MAG TPA: MmcQ/YjbR family DNA-binding protein [Archangium sp.]